MTSRAAAAAAPLVTSALLVATVLSGCAGAASTFPPIGSTPQPAGAATGATRQQVIRALAAAGLQAADSVRPFRPPEGPLLAGAPRSVMEVPLQNRSEPALFVVYALGSPEAALAAANDDAAYIRSNTGGIQFPPGTQFVLQVVGSNVIFFSWLPADSPDPGIATLAEALSKLGDRVPVSP